MKQIVPETLLDFTFVSEPKLSNNGKHLAFLTTKPNLEKNGYQSTLWVKDRKGEDQFVSDSVAGGYIWLVDDTLLYASTASDTESNEKKTCFFIWDAEKRTSRFAFTIPFPRAKLVGQNGEEYIFTASTLLKNQSEAGADYATDSTEIFTRIPGWFNGAGNVDGMRCSIFVFHPNTGECRQISALDYDVKQVCVSKGRVLSCGCTYQRRDMLDSAELRLYDISANKECVLLPAGQFDFLGISFMDEFAIAFLAPYSRTHPKRDASIYRIALDNGNMSLVAHTYTNAGGMSTAGSDVRMGNMTDLVVDGDTLYFTACSHGNRFLRSVRMDGHISPNLSPVGTADSFDAKAGRLVVCGMYNGRLTELYEQGRPITSFNSNVQQYSLSYPETQVIQMQDGTLIEGWCLRPGNYVPGQKFPGILEIHGGPRIMFGDVFYHEMQMLASAGYFVMFCNPRGSEGYGDAFADIGTDCGGIDYRDLMAFVDAMLERYPDMDEKRLGVSGGSYGGFMVNWIVGQTDRFRAAVSQRSTANWVSFTFTSDMGLLADPMELCTLREDSVRRAWNASPLKYVPNVKTPLLLLQSKEDYRCPMCDAVQMYTALMAHGADTKLCLFSGENHELSRNGRPASRIRRLYEILNWFDKHLKTCGENA